MLVASSSPPRFHPALMKQPRELAHLFTAWSGNVPADGIMAEEKRDGIRALYIDGRLLTREGNEIHGVTHIIPVLRLMEERAGHALFIDAEFQVGDSLRDTIGHFKRGPAAPDAGTLWAFDCIPLDQWRSDSCEDPLYRRKATLQRLSAAAIEEMQSDAWTWPQRSYGRRTGGDSVVVIPDVWLGDVAAVLSEAHRVWARGGEGLVLKEWDSAYRRRRTSDWQKVKRMISDD
ncbi:ATP-dependent DNA ligase [Sphingobium phenoxybenzoativorans]|uniref:ATP-dependent DNA ligase n=1 Tax=Sphingobium phenoxybenzoativorans TaxID=1592790 RepID=UPI001112EF40|nr:hypothetical protein [Sphingobium phenoxybenzoativorans]